MLWETGLHIEVQCGSGVLVSTRARLDERGGSWSRCDRTYREGHRLEVVVGGLSIFAGVQLGINTTPVSPLGRDSTAKRCSATRKAVSLTVARWNGTLCLLWVGIAQPRGVQPHEIGFRSRLLTRK